MNSGFTIGRISGVKINVHPTWLFAFFFIAWTNVSFFDGRFAAWSDGQLWLAGFVGSAALFGSVLIHELAHAISAQRFGMQVLGITLFIFGGFTEYRSQSRTPLKGFLISFAGPASNLILGGLCLLAWLSLRPDVGSPSLLVGVIFYLGFVNILLGLLNLLPALPLDGGGMLQAIVAAWTKSESRGTQVAAFAGTLIGVALIGFGILRFVAGDTLGGIWMAFIGLFLYSSARSQLQFSRQNERAALIPVRPAVHQTPTMSNATDRVTDVMSGVIVPGHQQVVPVLERDVPIGFFTEADARRFPLQDWRNLSVGSVIARHHVYTVQASADAIETLSNLESQGLDYALVLSRDLIVGVVSRVDLEGLIRLQTAAGASFDRPSA